MPSASTSPISLPCPHLSYICFVDDLVTRKGNFAATETTLLTLLCSSVFRSFPPAAFIVPFFDITFLFLGLLAESIVASSPASSKATWANSLPSYSEGLLILSSSHPVTLSNSSRSISAIQWLIACCRPPYFFRSFFCCHTLWSRLQ